MIIEMHGKLNTLLERSENHKSYLDSVSKKTKDNEDDISEMKSTITGLKVVGGLVTTIWTGVVAVFFKKL